MEIVLENVRTFVGEQRFPLGKITLLTGENSAGKSSFLAMISALFGSGNPFGPDFNAPPYHLGSFDTIATFKGGKYGRAKHFGMGFRETTNDGLTSAYLEYISDRGRPELSTLWVEIADLSLKLSIRERRSRRLQAVIDLVFDEGGGGIKEEITIPRGIDERGSAFWQGIVLDALFERLAGGREIAPEKSRSRDLNRAINAVFRTRDIFRQERVASLAPIRTEPERTYSRTAIPFEPAGRHVPYLLDRLLLGTASRRDSQKLLDAVRNYGRESGLFEDLAIKKLGPKATDPFQVMVKMRGATQARNLIDVGYGVSQSLPLVVHGILESQYDILLMQQPEVHLHPKAQAALGSFFVDVVSAEDRRLVIETHSDFIVDRVRMEIANGKLSPEDVSLLFFERAGYETHVHRIELDDSGSIVGAPARYREFFLREEMALLSRMSG